MNGGHLRPRVVFDCNALLQALGRETGPAAKALNLLEDGKIDVFLSKQILRELRRLLFA